MKYRSNSSTINLFQTASKDVNATFRMGDFAEFADALTDQREHTEAIVRLALKRVGERSPTDVLDELRTAAHTLDDMLSTVERAAEELRAQNDALFDESDQ